MMKRLVLAQFAILLCLSGFAQNIHRNTAVLNVFSYQEPFYLYLNGVKYNDKPSNTIRIESIPKNSFKVQVEFATTYRSTSSLSPVHLYNELGEALEVTLLADFKRSGTNDLVVYSYYPIRITIPDLNSFTVFDYSNPKDQLYEEQGSNHYYRGKQMPASEFTTFLANLRKQSFDKDKMKIVPLATSNYMFSVDQISQAMREFSWDEGKLEFAKYMYSRCLDRSSYLNLLLNLTFISYQNQLREFIQKESKNSSYIQRMSPNAFDDFIKVLKQQSFDNDKVSYIAAIASTSSFNVAQIKSILTTFSFDDGKLNAAKLLYDNCSDRQLYYTLADELIFDSNRNALLNFIKR